MEDEAATNVWLIFVPSLLWLVLGSALNKFIFSKMNSSKHPFKDILIQKQDLEKPDAKGPATHIRKTQQEEKQTTPTIKIGYKCTIRHPLNFPDFFGTH